MGIIKNHGFSRLCLVCKVSLFALFLAFFLCRLSDGTVNAAVELLNPKQTVYLTSKNVGYYDYNLEGEIGFSMELGKYEYIVESSLRTDNEFVTSDMEWGLRGEMDKQTEKCRHALSVYPQYPGSANLFFDDERKNTYVLSLNVLPYENPIRTLKITNIHNGKNLAGKVEEAYRFNSGKGEFGGLIYSKKTAVPKLKVEIKEGWKITTVKAQRIGSKMVLLQNLNAQSKTVELKKAGKGDELLVGIDCKNVENGGEARIRFGTSNW